ncbi:MAG: hypothetical protein ACYDEJ_02260 [Desulfitobacteriaceae bacterium]
MEVLWYFFKPGQIGFMFILVTVIAIISKVLEKIYWHKMRFIESLSYVIVFVVILGYISWLAYKTLTCI